MEEQPLLRTIGASARLQTVINLDKERYEKYKKNTCGCIAIVVCNLHVRTEKLQTDR